MTAILKLLRLVRNGDEDGLRTLLTDSTRDPIDLNRSLDIEGTPLMVACGRPSVNLDIIKLLIDKGADVDYQPYDSPYSPLMKAVEAGNIEAVKLLIRHGVQVDKKTLLKSEYGEQVQVLSALRIACEKNDIEVVKTLLEVEGIKDGLISGKLIDYYEDSDMSYSVSSSPFNTAIDHKHFKVVKWLLESGMVTDIPVGALLLAIKNQSSEMVQLLLDHGAQVNPTADGETSALMLASHHGNSEIVKMLLEKGAKVNLHNKKKVSALILAVSEGNVEVTKELLERGGADVNLKGKGGSTALLRVLSAEDDHVTLQTKADIVRLLLEYGANVRMQDNKKNNTPLRRAILTRSTQIVKLLVDKDKDLASRLNESENYLLWDALNDSPDLLQTFLAAGANPNGQFGIIPLMLVRDPNTARILIEHGANVDQQGKRAGEYPILHAVKESNFELVELLLEKSANITLSTRNGESAEMILKRNPQQILVSNYSVF